jgi:streptogramin lyase
MGILLYVLSAMAFSVPVSGASTGARPGVLIPVAGAQTAIVEAGQIWVATPRSLVQIDPVRRQIVARIRFRNLVASVAADGRFVWVLTRASSAGSALLYSVDIASSRLVGAPVRLFPTASGRIVAAAGSLWVTNDNHGAFGRLFRIDPRSRRVVAAVQIPNDPSALVYAGGSIWVAESDSGKVVRLDPRSGALEGSPIDVGSATLALAADGGKVWVADTFSGRLAAIDVSSARVIFDRPLAGLGGVAASHGKVWTFFFHKGEVAAVSGNGTIASKIHGGVDGVTANGRSVWAINPLGITPVSS